MLQHQRRQRVEVIFPCVQRRNVAQCTAALRDEGLTVLHRDLLQRFRQSAAKPGHTTSTSRTPFRASAASVWSV